MRLLELLPNGDLRLTKKILDNAVPRYAILSHRWEDDSQEVTFEDMIDGSCQGKGGYEKVKFCGEQAAKDGLQFFWVDSCCIKKSNDAELSESINSMFRWYHRAEKCYVYLSDVSSRKRKREDENTQDAWQQAFRASEWFTRGWTLQELLAPDSVEFFTREKKRLGDKRSLEQQIHEITGIPISALRGVALSQFSTDQRFDWAKNRQATREEDHAYSLLGIFGISMPVIYGEGREKADRRLRKEIDDSSKDKECLRHLFVTDPRADKVRIEDTGGGLIADSCRWILENDDFEQWRNDQQSHLLWVKGDPGKGKTMLLCGIVDELKKSKAKTHLLSFFYCQATDSRINNATAVLRGLLYLLIEQQPSLISHIQKRYEKAGQGLFEDANAWVALSDIFTTVLQDPSLKSTYLIIDALDECTGDLPKLLDFIIQKSSASHHVKWLVSSRNDANIERRLQLLDAEIRLSLEIKENAEQVSRAVDAYIDRCLLELTEIQDDKTLQDLVREKLRRRANGTFLWVSLVIKELKDVMSWEVLQVLDEVPTQLKDMYRRMIEQIKRLQRQYPELCRQVLSVIVAAYRPLHLQELHALSGLPTQIQNVNQSTTKIVKMCGSFLTIRDSSVYIIHQSAKDFLSEEASHEVFPCGIGDAHYSMCSKSLQIMTETLCRDIYGLRKPGYSIERVERPDPDPLIASRYSCIYWIDHLCDPNIDWHADKRVQLQDKGVVDVFLRKKFLYWLEALSLCKSVPKGVLGMANLETLIQKRADKSTLLELARDANRFIMYYKQTIQISPLQAYVSTLIFSPAGSLMRHHFEKEEPNWITIKPAVGDKWNACLHTLEGHKSIVTSVAFSHDSTRLASVSHDDTVIIWDASSGACLQTLHEYRGAHSVARPYSAVAFSHDSTRLASTSHNNTVRIWVVSSGQCLQELKGHSDHVASIAFSHNSTWLASVSHDRTVKIWDTSSGACLQTLKGYSSSVAFSHDSTWLTSVSHDNTVRIWDVDSGDCLQTLKGHSGPVTSVTFSHDSTRLASASSDGTIRIWDVGTGQSLQTLKGYGGSVYTVAFPFYSAVFSHDSARLASASHDHMVRIWDASSGAYLQTLAGHRNIVASVVFSHDSTWLASASYDNTVRIWDASSGACLQMPEAHSSCVTSVVFSHDLTRLASASWDRTVRIWDVSSGDCLQTLKGHSVSVTSVAFSHNSTRLVSASGDRTVKIWDVSSGDCLQTLEGHDDFVTSVAFSHDSARLASASQDHMVRIWDASSGDCLQELKGLSDTVNSVAFSHDSIRLVLASNDGTVRIWDASSGDYLQELKGHSGRVNSVAFSHDSTRLASASGDRTIRIWDASSGACLQMLDVGRMLCNISFDATGLYLHTDIGKVAVDAPPASGTALDKIERPDPRSLDIGLSPNGEWITCNSENLVWLPSEYRPSHSAVSKGTIWIGTGSGKVWMCKLEITELENFL